MSKPKIEEYNSYRYMIAEENPEALVVDNFDDCIVGISHRCGEPPLLVYSLPKIIDQLVARDGMSPDEAEVFAESNMVGSWNGPGTPIFLYP